MGTKLPRRRRGPGSPHVSGNWPGIERIAEDLGISESEALGYLAELASAGAIKLRMDTGRLRFDLATERPFKKKGLR